MSREGEEPEMLTWLIMSNNKAPHLPGPGLDGVEQGWKIGLPRLTEFSPIASFTGSGKSARVIDTCYIS